MITREGPQLIEYNVRFGDPEAQVLIPRLESDLATLFHGRRPRQARALPPLRWRAETALTVVLATRGYPGKVENGSVIRGVEAAGALPETLVFHAGTRQSANALARPWRARCSP